MGVDFLQMAKDMLGVVPPGFDFIYVIIAIALFFAAMLLFLVLPLCLISRGGRL